MAKLTSKEYKEDWMNRRWRPAMGWTYMITCIFDFIIFPVLWSVLQAYNDGSVTSQWQPLTLQGAGLYHMAMGAILGIAAWSRGQEKIAGAIDYGTPIRTGYTPTSYRPQPQTSYAVATPILINGRLAPVQDPEPEL